MSPRVWVVGSANLDLVFRTPRLPNPGETILGGPFASYPGGKGANQAVAAGKLGATVSFIGNVGADPFGETLRQSLIAAGVDTRYLLSDSENASGAAAILVDDGGQNEIIVAPGANMALSAEHVRQSLIVAGEEPVLVQLEIPEECVAAAAEGHKLFLNPAPARPLPDEILSRTFVITPNEHEAEILTGLKPTSGTDCEGACKALLDRGVKNVVLTLGENGCFWSDGKSARHVPAPKVRTVDTVAAGDAFNGALAWFHASGRDWLNCLELANHAAALSVTRHGAQTSMPTEEEFRVFAGHLL